MKVIGKVDRETYLVQVSHSEIEKFLNLYYNGKLKELAVGDSVDLGKGYNYHQDIQRAMKETREFVGAHKNVINAIINGLRIEDLASAADQEKPA